MHPRFYVFLLLIFTFCGGLHAQTSVPWCTAEMLDVRLFLPPESSNHSDSAHLLVVDLQNRGTGTCSLNSFDVHLPIEDGSGFRFGGETDHSPAAKKFADAQFHMAPGDEAHRVIAWSSVPQMQEQSAYDDCRSYEGFTTATLANQQILTVEHLWLEQCGQALISAMRAGPFVPGEELSAEWLARYGMHRSDIVEPPSSIVPTRLGSFDSIQYVKSTFESGYSGWFALWLERLHGATGSCAFRTLRRREADGRTTIVVNHCPPVKAKTSESSKRFSQFALRDYKMLPERIGRVDYETTAELTQNGKPATAIGITTVEIRDPTDPMLPAIETDLKPCRANQLALQATVELGDAIDVHDSSPFANVPRAGRAYTFTNASQETCLIGGTPDLQVPVLPESSGKKVGLGVCRNCTDALFAGRSQHWITLEPTQSAHFIVTGKPVYGIYHLPCAFWSKLFLANMGGTIELDYGLPACEGIDVSAWRDGAYDDDPLNLHYVSSKPSSDKPLDLPDKCAKDVTPSTGRPVMFAPDGAVQFGLSSRSSAFHDNAPLAIWAYNPTDNDVELTKACADINELFLERFDVLDQSGNRVLTKQEVKPWRDIIVCTRDFPISIASHSCIHGNLDYHGSGFVVNLPSMYTLPVGHYQVVPKLKKGDRRLSITGLAVDVTP
ncbi:hypothetical protein FTW19_23230 [Terriglobus albidus]|uniref:DUF4232 domain-containing protein n=1 Tax=Terriglobus albidus TaxID=1592106 RepID=A0A5B9EHL6_9BACT|nr:hypothetical protein [Terriglobus albidus]QEE30645.1 hypothetical protein FTW19_23230 [Terriglobus albidus]